MLNVNQTSLVLHAIEDAKRIVCMCHSNPDGDALGSLFGLIIILRKKFPSQAITPVCKDSAPDSFLYLPLVRTIEHAYIPVKGDLFISLDSGDAKQTGFLEELPDLFDAEKSKAMGVTTMKIDHHHTGSDFTQMSFVDSKASSTAEIIVDLADALNFDIPREAATCLLTGIYTDSGSMMHSNTTPRVYKTCARLLRAGADQSRIVHDVFRSSKLSTLKLWGRMLEKISISEEGGAVSAVTAGDFRATGADFSELTGAIDYVNSIPGMKFSLILSERDGKVKGSLRTLRDDVDVSAMAKKFDGGGHKRSAGFSINGTLEPEVRWKVVPGSSGVPGGT